ncbi:MAG: hypothetical protein H7X99_11975 [Saprospiraceae bacterium]|nr:hypothetical protein [Saprospiraceae bacterium]
MKYLLIYMSLFMVSPLLSQTDTSHTKLQLNQVEVIKTFEANLEDAQNITIKSVLPTQKPFSPSYKYDITIVPLELKYPDPQIKPLAMNPDGPFKMNKGYLNVAYGVLQNPEITAGYHATKKDTYNAGIHIDITSLNNTKKIPFQKYSNIGLDLYGSYMIKENMKLYGGINGSSKIRYFYHTDLNVAENFNEQQSKRKLNTLDINAGISNAERTKNEFNYNINLALNSLNLSNSDGRENGIIFKGHVEKHIGSATVFLLNASFDHTAINADTAISLITTRLTPWIKTKFGNLIVQLGVDYTYDGNSTSSFFPEVLLSFGVAGPNLQVFAGLRQQYYTNNFRNVTSLNPYLSTNITSIKNTINQEYFAGLKGQFSFLNYQIKAGYKTISNQMLLLNTSNDKRYFDMLFDDVNVIYASGNLDFGITENVSFGGWLTQNVYDLKMITNAWHLPNIEANVYTKISFLDSKLLFAGELFFNDKVPFLNKDNVFEKSNILFDLNTSIVYKITDKISVVAKGINLLDNKFERWYGYPSVGINGLLGVSVLF